MYTVYQHITSEYATTRSRTGIGLLLQAKTKSVNIPKHPVTVGLPRILPRMLDGLNSVPVNIIPPARFRVCAAPRHDLVPTGYARHREGLSIIVCEEIGEKKEGHVARRREIPEIFNRRFGSARLVELRD